MKAHSLARKAPTRRPPDADTDIALVVGRAAWWQPAAALASNNNKKQKLSFAAALRDFLAHVSFHCYGKLVEPGHRCMERFFWLIFHIVALTILIIFLWNTRNVEEQLMSTTIYEPLYPIGKVPFPSVSICSLNRISNASTMRYAEKLSAKDPRKRGVNYFHEQLQMMTYNYFSQEENIDYGRALEFQRFLDLYDTEDYELYYNTKRHMQKLTPSCNQILVHCRLAGKPINCTEQFVQSLTSRGFCCIFNINGHFKQSLYGKDHGLVVVLNDSIKDTLYSLSNLSGFMTTIYSPGDYADVSSGGVMERYAQIGLDTYIPITARMLRTVKEARHLRPTVRNCLFKDEMPDAFGRSYSFNKCLTRCRIYSILVLCQCLMFMSPFGFLDPNTETVYCTLKHKECLRRYDYKWRNIITRHQHVLGLEREMEDALYCPECLPSCTETRYRMTVMTLPLNTDSVRSLTTTMEDNNTNLTMVHIFFGVPHIQYFNRILKESWFEVFSTVGSICGIVTGFSLIGICEVIFFFAKQFLAELRDDFLSERRHRRQLVEPLIILP